MIGQDRQIIKTLKYHIVGKIRATHPNPQYIRTMSAAEFVRILSNPIKFRLFLLRKLPAAFFSGVRIREIDEHHCVVTVPFKWLTQNPFRSTYFASLSMAAEMSTGALAMAHIYKRKPAVSMLVVKVDSQYMKKATARTKFTCNDGAALKAVIEKAVSSGEPQAFTARSTGVNKEGETVAEFLVSWSFKVRSK